MDYCDNNRCHNNQLIVFISCLDSHSDGTHSLQSFIFEFIKLKWNWIQLIKSLKLNKNKQTKTITVQCQINILYKSDSSFLSYLKYLAMKISYMSEYTLLSPKTTTANPPQISLMSVLAQTSTFWVAAKLLLSLMLTLQNKCTQALLDLSINRITAHKCLIFKKSEIFKKSGLYGQLVQIPLVTVTWSRWLRDCSEMNVDITNQSKLSHTHKKIQLIFSIFVILYRHVVAYWVFFSFLLLFFLINVS